MAQALFHVAELIDIRGRGLVVAADIPVSKANFKLRIGDAVEFVRPDGSRLRPVVRGIEMVNPYNPDRSFALLVGREVAKSDIEPGAEVWQVQAADA
jgi:hypothetical protein